MQHDDGGLDHAAKVDGADIEATFVPTHALSITASATQMNAKYTSFPNATCSVPRVIAGAILGGNATVACNNTGHYMVNAPKTSFNLRATYIIETSEGSFALAANDSYKSRSYWDASNRLSQDPYHLISASVTWTAPSGKFDVQLFGRNLTNTYYDVMATETTNDVYAAGAPRTYGVMLSAHY